MTDRPGNDGFNRREFVRLLSNGTLLLVSGGLLAGCGGGGSNGSSSSGGSGGTTPNTPSTATQALIGTINTAQIGGTGLLVQSVYQPDTPVNQSGGFSTTVSSQGAHLLAVTDSGGQLRGLGLSMPGNGGAAAQAVAAHIVRPNASTTQNAIDATSTATGIIFLTPGVVATDPTTAVQRVTQIQGLNSFVPLAAYLSSNLSAASLPTLIQTGTLTSLAYACVQEWQSKYNSPSASGQAKPHVSDGETFNATFGTGPMQATPVGFSNGEFRYVNIERRYVTAQTSAVGSSIQVYETFVGAAGFSISDLLHLDVAKPNTGGSDTVDLTTSNVASVEYWVRGPGIGGPSLPDTIGAFSDDTAIGASFLLYLVLPLLDAVLGLNGAFEGSEIFSDIADAWDAYHPALDTASVFSDLAGGDSGKAVLDALVSLVTNQKIQKAMVTIFKNRLSASTAFTFGLGQLFDILKFVSQTMDIMTVLLAVSAWATYPRYAKISLPVNATGTVGVTVQ